MRTALTVRAAAVAATLALAGAVLAGCGSETATTASDDASDTASSEAASSEPTEDTSATEPESETSSPSGTSTPRPLPACAKTWRDGATLPLRYRGCVDGNRKVLADKRSCSSGQVVVTYAARYYAVLGGPVNDEGSLASSQTWQQVQAQCGA